MKSNIIFALILLFSASVGFAQKDSTATKNKPAKSANEIKVDESIAKIKKEIENIKNNIDSAKLREMAKELGKSAEEIGGTLEDIADEIEKKADKAEEKAEKKGVKIKTDSKDDDDDDDDAKKGNGKKEKSSKPARRTKMYMDLGIGLTGMKQGTPTPTLSPEYKTWGSNYWDLGLKFKTRIGGATSPAAITYGLTYLLNSFETTNDVKIAMDNNAPVFAKAEKAKSTELNIGYVTLPLGLEFKIGKKGKFGVGAYGGYRVRAVQNIKYRADNEDIDEKRKGNYGLNDLMYGASVKIGVGGLVLNGRYNLSSVFKENTIYKNLYNIYNVGLSFGF
jgi:hypothetical protein